MQIKHSGTCAWLSPSSFGCVCVTRRWVHVTVLPLCLVRSSYKFVNSFRRRTWLRSLPRSSLCLRVALQCLCWLRMAAAYRCLSDFCKPLKKKTNQQFKSNCNTWQTAALCCLKSGLLRCRAFSLPALPGIQWGPLKHPFAGTHPTLLGTPVLGTLRWEIQLVHSVCFQWPQSQMLNLGGV